MSVKPATEFNFWKEFMELFRQSVVIQSLITLILLAVVGYLVATGQGDKIPAMWEQLTIMVVGYWIGAKGNFQAVRAQRESMKAMEHMVTTFAKALSSRDGSS